MKVLSYCSRDSVRMLTFSKIKNHINLFAVPGTISVSSSVQLQCLVLGHCDVQIRLVIIINQAETLKGLMQEGRERKEKEDKLALVF